MDSARSRLEQYLKAPLGPGLGALGDTDLAALADTVDAAAKAQNAALAEAIEQGLQVVPRLLRGTVRKALFG